MEGIIALPSQLFYSTGIPVSLWFLSRHKQQPGKVLFIDARNMGTMVTRAVRELMQDDIQKIAETFEAYRKGTLEDEAPRRSERGTGRSRSVRGYNQHRG